jgi:hypothetical protein
MQASGFRLFWVLIVVGALFVVRTLADLPATVATNFGGGGAPHAWIGRGAYVGYLALIGLVLPLAMVAIMGRRGGARAGRWWLGSLMVGLTLGVHTVILGAHRTQPPQLSTRGFVGLLGLFVVGLVSWILHWRRAGRPPNQSSSRRPVGTPGEQSIGGFVDSWPFADTPNTAAITTRQVLEGAPVLRVTHDADDGSWQFLCGTTDNPADARSVGLGWMYARDGTLGEVADLPEGWRAWRASPGLPWERGRA